MKKIITLVGVFAVSISYAQIKFEKGYMITNSGEKKEVLIKNLDWKNNPEEFEYKQDGTSAIKNEGIKNIQEFGIEAGSRYVRKTVMLDQSSKELNQMSEHKNPDFTEKTVFLKYVVDGKAGLLYYENNKVERFFYTLEGSEAKQLVYKPYYSDYNTVNYNEEYKKHIYENLNCGLETKVIQNTKYTEKELTKIFTAYNQCSGGAVTNYTPANAGKHFFHLNIRPGVNFSSVTTTDFYGSTAEETKISKTSFRIGLEAEYVLPFNKNKWALFIEPTYQYFKGEADVVVSPGTYFETQVKKTVDYKSIELPIGIRHYLFINDQSKIFINAAYVFDFSMNSTINNGFKTVDITSGSNAAFGVGYKYKNRYSAEFRITTARNLKRDQTIMNEKYTTSSLILGYTLF
ncbi:hypothetical protein SAMN05421594_1772 [Chryseobacterium oleae]|uniref:Outer membrane protein beta-barrel domain-containing protein n=1 Tax=Chryseobacterium oleae TaxID=491207 RepID=A0A1I4XEM8_CHROL|nr:hypothetical protein [Chryseobacterium oleae]SFN24225.1 hypothetical protein SAMN05421594_1772 [Chryseobacterium oleae]